MGIKLPLKSLPSLRSWFSFPGTTKRAAKAATRARSRATTKSQCVRTKNKTKSHDQERIFHDPERDKEQHIRNREDDPRPFFFLATDPTNDCSLCEAKSLCVC